MKKINYILIVFALNVSMTKIYAQEHDVRKIKLEALAIASKYEMVCGVGNDDKRDDFIAMFKTDAVEILNDILPDNNTHKKVPVKDYVDIIPRYFSNPLKIDFRPYAIEVSEIQNGNRNIIINGLKAISCREKETQVVFSDTLDIYIQLSYNLDSKIYNIIDIGLNEEPGKYIVASFFYRSFWRTKPLRDDSAFINGKIYLTKEDGKILIKDIKPDSNLQISPPTDIFSGAKAISYQNILDQTKQTKNKNVIEVIFRKPFLEVGLDYSQIIGGKAPIRYDQNNNNNISSNEYNISVGGPIKETKKGYWKWSAGLGYFNYKYSNSISQVQTKYAAFDPDNSNYTRIIHVNTINERSKISGFSFPLFLEKGFRVINKSGIFLQAGIVYSSLQTATYESSAIGSYSGNYPDLFNITMSENGVYDFGTYDLSQKGEIPHQKNYLAFQLGIGIFHQISKNVKLRLGIAYKENTTELFQKDNLFISSKPAELNPMTLSGKTFKLHTVLLNIGLTIKI